MRLIIRKFTVQLPVSNAWNHLSRVEEWPRWASHIRRIELVPPTELGAQSVGRIFLRNGIRSSFRMVEFDPPHSWKWVGAFLWLSVHYDHRFAPMGTQRTQLIWIVDADGWGVSFAGRLFAAIYSRNLDRAIPALVAEMNNSRSSSTLPASGSA